ncbi:MULTISPECIES: hypothetical protein [unclassified Pseudomonas]|uniref:hypothetical protein n=1 Tax=unclassified Pseudomonas TaxID=196821 RepID=UPI0015AE6E02|nr:MULTISPECIES: hypothetical protein [unclassified Pseudomonas]
MANPADAQKWRDGLSTLAPQLEFRQWPDIGNPAEVHYILAWEPLASLAEQFGNLRLLYAAGAGVDQFDLARLPAHVSLIRLVDFHRALQKDGAIAPAFFAADRIVYTPRRGGELVLAVGAVSSRRARGLGAATP